MKQHALAIAISAALLGATAAHGAARVNFGNGQGALTVGAFDWTQTSLVAVNGNAAIGDWIATNGGCTGGPFSTDCEFDVYSHAVLGSVQDTNGQALIVDGLNTDFEVTVIWGLREKVAEVTTFQGFPLAGFELLPDQDLFLQVFYDDTPDSVPLTGYGFSDGRLVLDSRTIDSATGNFTVTQANADPDQEPLDDFGVDNYPGQYSVFGNGSQGSLSYTDFEQDYSFFVDELIEFGFNLTNFTQNLAFTEVNPSDCFTPAAQSVVVGSSTAAITCNNAHEDGPYSAQTTTPATGYLPVPGERNGAGPFDADSGPDFLAQSDYNSSPTSVPAPAPIALLGAGIFAMALRRRRAG